MEEEARKSEYTVVLLTHQDDVTRQGQALLTLRRCRAEGVILAAAPGTTMQLIQAAIPNVAVVALENFFSPEIDSILLQNRQTAREATEHLLDHGYQSVACVGARPNVISYQDRVAGYTDAVSARGVKSHVIMAPDFAELSRFLRNELSSRNPDEAFLVLSDVAAAHVFGVCQELSIPPEKRPKMIAFDEFDFAPLLDIPLTVVRQPIALMIEAAVAFLFRQIDVKGAGGSHTISMPGELVIRRSCGCS